MDIRKAKLEQHVLSPVDELVGEIEYLNDEYRAGNPQVSDQYYDGLLTKLATLAPEHPLLKKGVIERAPEGKRKRKLPVPMMSLNKEKSLEDIIRWLKKMALTPEDWVIITGKYNGISLLVDFGSMLATTRGNGMIGQECDAHFKEMRIPKFIGGEALLGGEAIISRANWKQFFEGKTAPSGLPYRLNNATVAGLLNNDEPTEMLKYVEFIPYHIKAGAENMDKFAQVTWLNINTDRALPFLVLQMKDLTETKLDSFYQNVNQYYPIDGLVIDIDAARFRQGTESNGNPAYARALKLDKWVEEFDTEITGYKFSISKQGKLKGVVTFEPVFINGTEVKQATFYNALFLHDFNLGPGVKITVKKSGEIIPKIVKVEGVKVPIRSEYKNQEAYEIDYVTATDCIDHELEERGISIEPVVFCPSCGYELEWDESTVELLCKNTACRDMRISKIEHFFVSLGVEEFGRQTIDTLFDEGYDTTEAIFKLSREKLASIEGFGNASADIILNEFERVKKEGVPLARLLYAWDLFEGKIAEKTAQLILDNVKDLNNMTVAELVEIKGVSDITAQCFIDGLNSFPMVPDIMPVRYIVSPAKKSEGTKFAGFSVCFSGLRDKALEQVIESQGGQVVSGVSKKTTHLVVADKEQLTQKTEKARELGIHIMTLDEFKAL